MRVGKGPLADEEDGGDVGEEAGQFTDRLCASGVAHRHHVSLCAASTVGRLPRLYIIRKVQFTEGALRLLDLWREHTSDKIIHPSQLGRRTPRGGRHRVNSGFATLAASPE